MRGDFVVYSYPDWATPEDRRYTVRDIVEGMGYDPGLTDYPIFKESYRDNLNSGILAHFWFREVAADTPARFLFYLNRKMCEVMPSFNALYAEISRDGFDAFSTGRAVTRGASERHESTSGESSGTNSGDSIVSDTPQQMINDADSLLYANQLSRTTGKQDGTSASTASVTASNEGESYATADTATRAADLINGQYLNVDAALYNALEVLFMQTWSDAND